MLENFRNVFNFGTKKFLGIDIGTSSIRIIELAKKRNIISLNNYAEVKSSSFVKKPFRVFTKNSVSLSNIELGEAIKTIMSEAGIETKQANLGIPDFSSFFTSFQIPVMSREEIPQAIQYEVRPYIPLPLLEVTLDWIIMEGEPSKTPLKILVVAIPNDVVMQYKEIAKIAGLELKSLESEVFALARAAARSLRNGTDDKKVFGLIDIGARSTTCSIIEKGILKYSYTFGIGGNELTEVVAKSFNIDYNEGEEMKIKTGLLTNGDMKRDVRKVLSPMVDSILEEIKEVFRNYYREEGKEVEKVILAGGMAKMVGLKEYFAESLKKEVVIVNPFLNINYPLMLKNTLGEIGPLYTIAVGLALNGLE
jgi:type IV pilus assembly protein PilM